MGREEGQGREDREGKGGDRRGWEERGGEGGDDVPPLLIISGYATVGQ